MCSTLPFTAPPAQWSHLVYEGAANRPSAGLGHDALEPLRWLGDRRRRSLQRMGAAVLADTPEQLPGDDLDDVVAGRDDEVARIVEKRRGRVQLSQCRGELPAPVRADDLADTTHESNVVRRREPEIHGPDPHGLHGAEAQLDVALALVEQLDDELGRVLADRGAWDAIHAYEPRDRFDALVGHHLFIFLWSSAVRPLT